MFLVSPKTHHRTVQPFSPLNSFCVFALHKFGFGSLPILTGPPWKVLGLPKIWLFSYLYYHHPGHAINQNHTENPKFILSFAWTAWAILRLRFKTKVVLVLEASYVFTFTSTWTETPPPAFHISICGNIRNL